MDVLHTALWVSDRERTEAFYVDALGLESKWEFVGDDGVTNFYVGGDGKAELQFKHDPDADKRIEASGFDHHAVEVDDADETVEHMVETTGCDVIREPFTSTAANLRAAFIEDPDGYVVEIISPLD